MQNVSAFEAHLLRLLYYFLRREPIERAMPLVEARMEMPAGLSSGALRLVRDALAKGCTFLLAQRGGWRDEPYLRKMRKKSGRLWQRTAPENLGLRFSGHTLRFLLWITAVRPSDKQPTWTPDHDQLTQGDLLLLFFAHEGLRDATESLGVANLRKREPFNRHGLCWLAYPEDFTQVADGVLPNFGPWLDDLGACILEALQPELALRWITIESSKERIEQPALMRSLGASQDRVLDAYLTALEKANRRDLARFLLRAGHQLLNEHAHSGMWTGALQMSGQRLVDRTATYQAATSLLRHLERLAGWTQWARGVWRFDEEFEAAQLWLEDWEQFGGDHLVPRAQGIIRNLDPLRQAQAQTTR
ncbi:MAG: hypothetical protein U0840_14210 [Gemmataceae bacterium]